MRLDAVQRVADHERIGAVAANQPMLAKQPNVARRARRDGRRIRRFVRVRQPSILVERQRRYFVGAKADQAKIEAGTLQVVDLDAQHGVVPAGVQRQLIVRKHIGALLRRRPACRNHDRDFSYPKLVRRKHAAMPGDNAVCLIDQRGNRPAPFADRRRDLINLLGAGGGCVESGLIQRVTSKENLAIHEGS